MVKLKEFFSGFEENIEVKQYPPRIRFARFAPSWMETPKINLKLPNTRTLSRRLAIDFRWKKGSTKSHLYEICAVNHWKAPLFECCNEEGPDHHKLFTLKVIVETRGPRTTTIEWMGNPHSKKKAAAENAAEGALWFLNLACYRLKH